MDIDTQVKVAVYRAVAESGRVPTLEEVMARTRATSSTVRDAYRRLQSKRLLLNANGCSATPMIEAEIRVREAQPPRE